MVRKIVTERTTTVKELRPSIQAPEIMKLESYRSTEHISGLSFFDLVYELSLGVSVVVILFASMALIIWLIDYSVARYESRKLAYSN